MASRRSWWRKARSSPDSATTPSCSAGTRVRSSSVAGAPNASTRSLTAKLGPSTEARRITSIVSWGSAASRSRTRRRKEVGGALDQRQDVVEQPEAVGAAVAQDAHERRAVGVVLRAVQVQRRGDGAERPVLHQLVRRAAEHGEPELARPLDQLGEQPRLAD